MVGISIAQKMIAFSLEKIYNTYVFSECLHHKITHAQQPVVELKSTTKNINKLIRVSLPNNLASLLTANH